MGGVVRGHLGSSYPTAILGLLTRQGRGLLALLPSLFGHRTFICINIHERQKEVNLKNTEPDNLEVHFELNSLCL